MLTHIHPKLPSRDLAKTRSYYVNMLEFEEVSDYGDYLILSKDHIEIHFFLFSDLIPSENDGQVYIRCSDIGNWYKHLLDRGVPIHPNAPLSVKPWGQKEFSLLDPDSNCLTIGETYDAGKHQQNLF